MRRGIRRPRATRVTGRQSQAISSMGGVGRVLTPLENRASLSNVATQEGVVSPQGCSFLKPLVAGLSEPEIFAQARRNDEMLLSNGAQWQPLALQCFLALLHPLLV